LAHQGEYGRGGGCHWGIADKEVRLIACDIPRLRGKTASGVLFKPQRWSISGRYV